MLLRVFSLLTGLGLLFNTAAAQQQGDAPDADDVKAYSEKLLSDFMPDFHDQVKQQMQKLEGGNDEIFKVGGDGQHKDDNPYRRGASESWEEYQNQESDPERKKWYWLKADIDDAEEIEGIYKECASAMQVGICISRALLLLPAPHPKTERGLVPEWQYYKSANKVEATEYRFFSAIYTRQDQHPNKDQGHRSIKEMMDETDKIQYDEGDENIQDKPKLSGKKTDGVEDAAKTYNERAKAQEWCGKNTQKCVKEDGYEEFVKETKNWDQDGERNMDTSGAGGRTYMWYHVSDAWHSKRYRDEQQYNMIEINPFAEITWCDKGSKHHYHGTTDHRPKVPYWFSEGPFGIMISRFDSLNYKVNEIKDDLVGKTDINHCRKQREQQGFTPQDIGGNPDNNKQKTDNDEKCIGQGKTQLGRYRYTAVTDTAYHVQGAVEKFYAGNNIAGGKSDFSGADHAEGGYGNKLEEQLGHDERFHKIKRTGTITRRDRFSFIFPTQGERKVEKGCSPWSGEQDMIPNFWGAKAGQGNHNYTKEGNMFRMAHWVDYRCCPYGYELLFGILPYYLSSQPEEEMM